MLVGTVVDRRYRVVRKVGEGTSAEVFEAKHVHLNKLVALKVLRSELTGDSDSIIRFQREAQVTSELGHPNIVRVEDFFFLDEGFFLAMEWLDGETLDSRLSREQLDLDDVIAISAQACSGLEAAHDVEIIHRDLKPENMFLVDGPRGKAGLPTVKILDFGIAKFTHNSDLTGAGVFLGTPYYVAPEQALARDIDNRADIYSLGIIMYQMVTGTLPFKADRALEVLRMHVEAEPVPPRERAPGRGIDPELEKIILRCMEKDPKARFARASEIGDALLDLESESVPTLPGARPPTKRNRRLDDSDARTILTKKNVPKKKPGFKLLPLDDADIARVEFEEMSKTLRVKRNMSAKPPKPWKAPEPTDGEEVPSPPEATPPVATPRTKPPPPPMSFPAMFVAILLLLVLAGGVGIYLVLN